MKVTFSDVHNIVDAFATALDAKNSCMLGHSERVAEISLVLARSMGLPLSEQSRIHIGAHLHDIGKIGIPDAILNKTGRLSEAEFSQIRRHPEIGNDIIGRVRVLEPVSDIVRHHHERFDGEGYPDRLIGEQISLGARVVAVADAYDAMTTMRSYRPALAIDEALREMRQCRGTQFDPQVVDVLLQLEQKGEWPFFPERLLVGRELPLKKAVGFLRAFN